MEKNNNTFHDWVQENYETIAHELKRAAIDFLFQHSEERITLDELTLDGKWQYLDRKKTKGFIGQLLSNQNNIPQLKLTYHSFKQGGESYSFDNKPVIKHLWENERYGTTRPYRSQIVPRKLKQKISEKKPSEIKVKEDLALWNKLSTTGISDYLKRKQIQSQSEIKGIKFGKNLIAVKIIDIEGRAHGLQKIYNDGRKLFTKGLEKKGHFALIGADNIPKNTKRLSICEGISTAVSIYLATGEPVYAALDAFNLLPVSKNLKSYHTRAEFIYWADNDHIKANKLKPNGEKIGNTGLIHANRAALKMRRALVMTPDFSKMKATTQITEPTDFNDMHCLYGLDAILKIKPQKPNLRLALRDELKKTKKYIHGTLSPNQFKNAAKSTFNDRYLPEDLIIKEGVNLIRSPIGTGKTQAIESLLKENKNLSVLFTTHLISLVESGAKRLGLCSYNACDAFDLQMERRLAICLNSLAKLTLEGPIPQYDVLVIDEIEQVLSRLTNPLEHKTIIFKVLKQLIESAKYVICLDAHLSSTTISLIKAWIHDKKTQIYLNEYQVGQDKEVILYSDKESLQISAMQALESQQKAYLTFNSKTEAAKTFEFFRQAFPQKKGLYISGDNTGDKETIAFFSDVNKASKKYDFVICTPSVSTGVSIDNNHFNFVAGFFNSTINTANDCAQALGRVRNINKTHVYCETRRGDKPLNPELIAAKWNETHQYDLKLMNLTHDGKVVLFNEDYEQLAVQTTLQKNRSFNNFYEEFALLMLSDGYNFSYAEITLQSEEKKFIRESKKSCFELMSNQAIQSSQVLSEAEIIKLENKARKTRAESLSFEKQKLSQFFKVNDNETLIHLMKEDNQGKLRKKILSLELGLSSKEFAKTLYEKQYAEHPQFVADLKHYATEQELIKKLLDEFGLNFTSGLLTKKDYIYNKESLLSGRLIPWIKQNYQRLSGVISLPKIHSIEKSPIRLISRLLDLIGLKQKRVGKNELGTYQLEEQQFLFIQSIISKRNLIAGDSSSNIYINTATTVSIKLKDSAKVNSFNDVLQNLGLCFDKLKSLLTKNKNQPHFQINNKTKESNILQNLWLNLESTFKAVLENTSLSQISEERYIPQLFVP